MKHFGFKIREKSRKVYKSDKSWVKKADMFLQHWVNLVLYPFYQLFLIYRNYT